MFELERCHFLKGEPSVVLETLCFIGSEYKRENIHAEITEFLTIRARVTLQVNIGVRASVTTVWVDSMHRACID